MQTNHAMSRTMFLAGVAALWLAAWPGWAQTNVGQISGLVLDPSGASVAGCTVIATHFETGLARKAQTDAGGVYFISGLPVGTYNLRAEATGFRSFDRKDVVLNAAARLNVDFRLEIGTATESISVTASTEEVETASGEIGHVVTGTQVKEIGLNGRHYVQMLRLLPGVAGLSTDVFTTDTSTNRQSINGQRNNSSYFMVDGVDNTDTGSNASQYNMIGLEAISEIKVLASSYSAEFGGRSGAMVNVVTKGGTKEFHGSVFEYVRNDVFDARDFFAREKNHLRFNNFGFNLGGPVFIPRKWNTDRNKVFFFISQEWRRRRVGNTRLSTIPTADERAGNFRNSSLTAPIDPLNGMPFPDATVPAFRFSENGPRLLKPYPLPNISGASGNFLFNGVDRTDAAGQIYRADYVVSSSTQIMGRYAHDSMDRWDAAQGANFGVIPGIRPFLGYSAVLSISQTFSPTMLNYFSFSGSGNHINSFPQNEIMSRTNLGLTYTNLFPFARWNAGPNVNIAGFTGYGAGNGGFGFNTKFQWRDDFSKVIGSHMLKFGAQITRGRKQENAVSNTHGAVTFNTSATGTTRNALADLLLGNFYTYSQYSTDNVNWLRWTDWEFYAQDSWKVNRRLSLELGLRYNIVGAPYSALNILANFVPSRYNPADAPQINPGNGARIPNTGNPLNGMVICGSGWPKAAIGRVPQAEDPSLDDLFIGLPRGCFENHYKDFGPRFGFAWDVMGDGMTAVRGGYGIFYDFVPTSYPNGLIINPPFAVGATVYNGSIDNPGGGTQLDFPSTLYSNSIEMKTPMVQSYNLGVQRRLPGEVLLEVNYVGNQGHRLARRVDLNQLPEGTRLNPPNSTTNPNALRPYYGYGSIQLRSNTANSNYHSLQVSANRRMSKGLSFGAAYTWSKAIDDASQETEQIQNTYRADLDRALSTYDRRHILVFNYVYELPFFRTASNPVLKNALGGWSLAGITTYQSGAPFTVRVPVDVARVGVSSSRATSVGDPRIDASGRTVARWFNTEAFLPADKMVQGRWGTSARNLLRGPAIGQWDVSLMKNFSIRERTNLQFRAESFNTWNHPYFTTINTTVNFDRNGKPTSNYGAVTASGPGRVLEFGLKLSF